MKLIFNLRALGGTHSKHIECFVVLPKKQYIHFWMALISVHPANIKLKIFLQNEKKVPSLIMRDWRVIFCCYDTGAIDFLHYKVGNCAKSENLLNDHLHVNFEFKMLQEYILMYLVRILEVLGTGYHSSL
jgi:hypothetical protein